MNCTIISAEGTGFAAFLDTGTGAAYKLTQNSQLGPPVDTFTVNGFLVTAIRSQDPAACLGVVDTGDGQNLEILAYSRGGRPIEETCRTMKERMPIVMDTLAAMQPP